MKRTVLIGFIFVLAFTLVANEEFDFRKTRWGMGQEEVKQTETSTLKYELGFLLSYSDTIMDYPVMVAYSFVEKKLNAAVIVFSQEHGDLNEYITDFEKLYAVLVKKYGPSEIVKEWKGKSASYKDKKEKWGKAILKGLLSYKSSWKLKRTEIDLTLKGEKDKLSLGIRYADIDQSKYKTKTEDKL